MKILIITLFAILQVVYSNCVLTSQDLNNAVFTAVDDPLCKTLSCFTGDTILTLEYDSKRISSLTYKAKDQSSPKQSFIQTTPNIQNKTSIDSSFLVVDGFSTYNVMQSCTIQTINGKTVQVATFKVQLDSNSFQSLTLNTYVSYSLIKSAIVSLLVGLTISLFI